MEPVGLFFGGFASIWLLAAVVPIGLVVLGVVALTNRRDDDEAGQRGTAIYLGVICFFALFTVLFAGTAAVGKAASFIVPPEDRGGSELRAGWFNYSPEGGVYVTDAPCRRWPDCERPDRALDEIDDKTAREAIWAGLLFLPAAFVYRFHARRRRGLADGDGFVGSAAWRADRVYLHLVCTVAVVAGTIAVASLAYDVVRMIAPDITSSEFGRRSERERGLADAITMTVLALGATAIFLPHWAQVSGEPNPLRRLRRRRREAEVPDPEA